MIYVGIDVTKNKHDCFIANSDGEVLFHSFTISNNRESFESLFLRIGSVSKDFNKGKVEPEATGHYSYNLMAFLLDKGLTTFVINPLHTNLYRKSLSLRKTKTDKVDSRTIAAMMMSDMNLKSYSNTSYHNEELKSLTHYRFDKVKERAVRFKACKYPFLRIGNTGSSASYGFRIRFAVRVSWCFPCCFGSPYKTHKSAFRFF